ncbi:PilC/PilY family type IV pilus protein [bacterium]|nr:PilC/PilY family type IV pilus protein [bacterium]
MSRREIIRTTWRYPGHFICGVVLGMIVAIPLTSADDTEVFYGQVTTDTSSANNAPNVLFVLDDSLSMLSDDTNQEGSRLYRLRQAMNTILDQVENVNIGVMTLNGDNGGGPVRYPVTPVDKLVCADGGCDNVLLYSQIDNADNDVIQLGRPGQSLNGNTGGSPGEIINGTTELTIGFDNSTDRNQQLVGLRFEELGIPQGAEIKSAVLQVSATQTTTGGGNITIWGDDSDSAAPFSNADGDLSARTSTDARAVLNPSSWTASETYEEDVSNVIQELIQRPDWCGGNDIALIMESSNSHAILSQEGAASAGELSEEELDSTSDDQAASLRVTYDATDLQVGEGCVYETLVYQVVGKNNDAIELLDNGKVQRNWQNGWLGNTTDNVKTLSAFRFNNMEIDQGAEIVDARLEFVVNVSGTGTPSIKITAEDKDNSNTPPNGRLGLSKQTSTSASVIWEDSAEALSGSKIYTNDIAPVVQEIVDRTNWSSGNSMTLRLEGVSDTDYHSVKMFDTSAAVAARIYIKTKTFIEQGDSTGTGAADLTARDELKNLMDELRTNYYTPQLGAQYEAAQYMRGGPVDYGRKRGGTVINSNFRLSHPDSYTGGEVYTPPGCNSLDPYAPNCQDEEIFDDANGAAPTYITPMLDSCQTNHIVLLGDGEATRDAAKDKIHNLIGDSSCSDTARDETSCAAVLAKWLYENDNAPDIAGEQKIRTHTVAFNLTGRGAELFGEIATAGRGIARRADSADDLVSVFTSIIDGALSIDTSFAAPGATVNQFNRLAHRDDVYFALFKPSDTPKWDGNFKRYKLGALDDETSILDYDDNDAVNESTGFFDSSARSLWEHLDDDGNVTTVPDGATVSLGGAASRIGAGTSSTRKVYIDTDSDVLSTSAGIDLADGNHNLHESNLEITSEKLGIAAITPATDRELYRIELLKWVRGLDRLDKDEDDDVDEPRRQMGDPLHTNPVIVNYDTTVSDSDEDSEGDSDGSADGSSDESVDEDEDYLSVVFVTTNEGFLHAIDSETGNELWAFSPIELLENHTLFYENSQATPHLYGLDGPLSVLRDESNNNLIIENGESVYLYSAMRRGGNNYYAFDISDPNRPKLMWKIKGGPNGTSGFEELGQTWSEATTARILYEGSEKDVLIFGAGYDTNSDADPIRDTNGNAVTMAQTDDSIGRGLFIVDAETGALLWSVSGPDVGTDSTADQRFNAMTFSIPGSIRIVDIDYDGLVDQMYASDTGGQVWRFDVISDTSDDADLLQGGVVADISISDRSGQRRFYSEPDVALIQEDGEQYMAISIGSGWRDHPLNDVIKDAYYNFRSYDVRSTPTNYGLQESDGTWRPLTEGDLYQVNNSSSTSDTTFSNGWFLRLPDAGEKILASTIMFNNVVYFTTYVPEEYVEACSAGIGSGYFYALSVFDGQPVQDFDGDGTVETYDASSDDIRYALSHRGIPATATLLISEGYDPEIYVGIEKVPTSITNETKRTFWVDSGIE